MIDCGTRGKMSEADFSRCLEVWFQKHRADKNIWSTPVGKVIRDQIKARGHWKYRRRGASVKDRVPF